MQPMTETSETTSDIENTLLSERIARARHAAGLTQEELADRMGIRDETVRAWEAERAAPRANRLAQLAGILNVPFLWLVGGRQRPPEVGDPNLAETARIEQKLKRAESLLVDLTLLLADIRRDVKWVQGELDADF